MTEYDDKKEVSAVSFKIDIAGESRPFRLPCKDKAIFEILCHRKKRMTHNDKIIDNMKAQAKRVAWRQILRWIEAQLALVSTDMVTLHEVFLPYMQTGVNETLYQTLENKGFKFKQLAHHE